MNLTINSVTLQEVVGANSLFPVGLREVLCGAIERIPIETMGELQAKHESDPSNFDGKVEENIRLVDGTLSIKRDCLIMSHTKFNHDLVIETDESVVCVEIEKGYMARFEFDILKMQAFSRNRQKANPSIHIYGAFIVPFDNVVARHISGNSRESSYRYLTRISRLVAETQPPLLEDILIIGYGLEELDTKPARKGKSKTTKRSRPVKAVGLLPEEQLSGLQKYASEPLRYIRQQLAAKCSNLREKFNPRSRYLGYSVGGSDAAYIYIQKKRLLIDLKLSSDIADEIRSRGFKVQPRNNFQGRNGWLTGLIVPYDCFNRDDVVDLLLEALDVQSSE